jgi:hypothetical protein
MAFLNRVRLYAALVVFGCCVGGAFLASAQAPYPSSQAGSSAGGPISNRLNNRIDSRTSTTDGTLYQRKKAAREEARKARLHTPYEAGTNAADAGAKVSTGPSAQVSTGAAKGTKATEAGLPLPGTPLPPSLTAIPRVGTYATPGLQPLRSSGSWPYSQPAPTVPAARAQAGISSGADETSSDEEKQSEEKEEEK